MSRHRIFILTFDTPVFCRHRGRPTKVAFGGLRVGVTASSINGPASETERLVAVVTATEDRSNYKIVFVVRRNGTVEASESFTELFFTGTHQVQGAI